MNNIIFDTGCEKCPNLDSGQCPNMQRMLSSLKEDGDHAAGRAHEDSVRYFPESKEYPCKQIKLGPISCSYCHYLAGKAY